MIGNDRVGRTVAIGRATLSLARSEQLTFLAAAIAYYAFASVVPLILLATVAASVLVGDAFAEALVSYLGSILTPASQNVLESTLTSTAGRGSATVVGLLVLLWSSLKVFRALDTSFSIVYGEGTPDGFLQTLFDGVVAFTAVALAIAASTILVATLTVADPPFVAEFGVLFEIAVLTAAFYPLYLLFPDVDIGVFEALPGAVFAALGWTVLSGLFRFYVTNAASFALWGVLGAALVIVTWLYVGSLLLLLGAALNAVIAERSVLDVEPDVSASIDRHLQSAGLRQTEATMGDEDGSDEHDTDPEDPSDGDESSSEPTDRSDVEHETSSASDPETVDHEAVDHEATAARDPDRAGRDEETADPDDLRAEIDELKAEIAALRELREDVDEIEWEVEEIEDEVDEIEDDVEEMEADVDEFEDDVEARTVHRDEVERDLRRYVRWQVRRGKARGWGPYLVLLYGTVMTLGAFYTPYLTGGWAIFAMVVIWLSTLGLYVLMVLVGLGANALSIPGRLRDRIADWRS